MALGRSKPERERRSERGGSGLFGAGGCRFCEGSGRVGWRVRKDEGGDGQHLP